MGAACSTSSSTLATNPTSKRNFAVIILIGPPGCGKGTQAPKIVETFGFCHLSTGDMLRAVTKTGSQLGNEIKAVMERGELVSDDLLMKLLRDEVKKLLNDSKNNGIIFDGFPRTVQQAKMLDELLAAEGLRSNLVLQFSIEDGLLIRRIAGRRVHPGSGRSYHIEFNPPKVSGIDDVTGEPLIQRNDDNEETLAKRLESYHNSTTPVLDYYKTQGCLTSIDAAQAPEDVWNIIKKSFDTLPSIRAKM